MPTDYSLVVDGGVVEIIADLRGKQKAELFKALRELSTNPFVKGEFVRTSREGRRFEVKRMGKWHVTFWADHAVGELRIVDVRMMEPI